MVGKRNRRIGALPNPDLVAPLKATRTIILYFPILISVSIDFTVSLTEAVLLTGYITLQ